MSDNRATRAHIAASRGHLHEYLSTDALLTDEIADALMHDVAGKSEQFDTGESHGPLTALQALRANGGSAVDEHAARLAFASRATAGDVARERFPIGSPVRESSHRVPFGCLPFTGTVDFVADDAWVGVRMASGRVLSFPSSDVIPVDA